MTSIKGITSEAINAGQKIIDDVRRGIDSLDIQYRYSGHQSFSWVNGAVDGMKKFGSTAKKGVDGVVSKLFGKSKIGSFSIHDLLSNSNKIDPAGDGLLSKAGRALQKHSGRPDDIMNQYMKPTSTGLTNHAYYNQLADEIVQAILKDSNKVITNKKFLTNDGWIDGFQIHSLSRNEIITFYSDGSLRGFLNP